MKPTTTVFAALLFLQSAYSQEALTEREKMLLARIAQLEQRVAALEAKSGATLPPQAQALTPSNTTAAPVPATATAEPNLSYNLYIDGYYAYNFNSPIGRANLLRAYDVSSNAFSLNQATVVFESATDPDHGKRFGARLDLQFGQATQTLQGNSANEPRPGIYRNVFQAYGTYVAPVAKGLTIDFGKWASSLGIEGNYTKDQMNYSRSFWFDYLPFYHLGVRANFKLTDAISANYWVVNGTQQSEPFNGYKDELFGLALQPAKSLSWTINYYLGQEHPDTIYFPNGAPPNLPNLPTWQGVAFLPIAHPPQGKMHIFDSYATWNATPKLTLALEGDCVVQRLQTNSYPAHTDGGAGYLQYHFTPSLFLSTRGEYLSDRGGLFSGTVQALKEVTVTGQYRYHDQFELWLEWRSDLSNQPYFYTSTLGQLRRSQNTATIGVVWWYGPKQGIW